MKKQTIRILIAGIISASMFSVQVAAQEAGDSTGRSKNEVSELKKKVEGQEAEIKLLQQSLERQNELLETLRQKLEQAGKPALVPASVHTSSETSAAAPSEKKVAVTSAKSIQSVEAGNGKIKFNGLLQGWYAGGDGGFRDTFRVRRAEMKFTGEITPQARWTVMIDPSKALSLNNTFTTVNGARVVGDVSVNQAGRVLQDAFITLDYIKNVHIDAGQFKVPISLEGLQSSAALETVERAMFASDRARGGAYGDVRDLGVMIRGPLGKSVDYQLGLFNGSGENQNDLDKNDSKAAAARLVARPPFIKGLQIGGSGVWGNGQRADRPRRDRLGAEALYSYGPLTLKSELMTGADGDLHRRGYYTHAGYRITPKWEAVFRFDSWDPDTARETASSNAAERDYIGGLNYFIYEKNVKLQFNYLRKTFARDLAPSRNLMLVNLQTSW